MKLVRSRESKRPAKARGDAHTLQVAARGAAPLFARSAGRFLAAALSLLLSAGIAGAQGKPDGGTNSAPSLLQQFKDLISHPPVISNLVFQQKVPMGGGMRPLDGSFAQSTSFEYFQAHWQTNGFLFRRLSSPADVTNLAVAGQLVSWSGHQEALFESIPLLTTWDDRDPSVAGKHISVFFTSHFFLAPLRKVMNLGVMYAEIGGIRWDGNRFHTECQVQRQRLRITGEVFPSSAGRADHLRVRYDFPHETYRYVVRYGYSARSAYAYVPAVITSFWLDNAGRPSQKEIELDQWTILDLRLSDRPLEPALFSPAPFARQNEWPTRSYTNGAFYARMPDGTTVLTGELDARKLRRALSRRFGPAAFYASWAVLNLSILALALAVGAGNSKHGTQPENNEKGKANEKV
jgi:hypothetical protein